jgi:HSP20 family molecular chaperone IbpA
MPVIGVAETKDAIEVNAELPGVDEKDIKVSLDGNRLAISGEKKGETKKDEKDWHVEERRYGSFYRSLSLPFKPEDGAIEAHFDKPLLPDRAPSSWRSPTWHPAPLRMLPRYRPSLPPIPPATAVQ